MNINKNTIQKCCICGKEIVDEIHDGNNPDPLKDENGNWLSQSENPYCCKRCDNVYVLSARISLIYNLQDQFDLTQKKVLELRKGWLKK